MTAASIGWVGWCAIVTGSLCLYLGVAIGLGRMFRSSNPGEVDTAVDHPPLPPVLRVVEDVDYLADQPQEVVVSVLSDAERAEFDRIAAAESVRFGWSM